MTYAQSYTTATDLGFQIQVRMAALSVCSDIENELASTIGHQQRVVYARQVATNPDMHVAAIAQTICAVTPTLTTASLDSDVKTAISSVWNLLSGV